MFEISHYLADGLHRAMPPTSEIGVKLSCYEMT